MCLRLFPLFLLFFPLFAAPVGNPVAPQILNKGLITPNDFWLNVRIGYECDVISNGKMKQTDGSSGRVDLYEQICNSGTLTFNFLDQLDLYGMFGSARTDGNWLFTTDADVIQRVQFGTTYGFLWGVGGRLIVHQWDALGLGISGSYRHLLSHPSYLTLDATNESTKGTHLQWHEWQAGVALSYRMGILIPYLGAKYSQAHALLGTFVVPISGSASGNLHMQNRTPVGLFLGCTLSTGSYFFLNVEGRLFDEEAIAVTGEVRF